jgi:NAD(P)-dependent dehydrogenase (short-subunit alcohol dehydrogenase family)
MSNFERWFGVNAKNVLITGAAGQIGTALAEGFKDCGANVYGFDLNEPSDKSLFSSFVIGDLTNKDEVKKAFHNLFGEDNSIHILINNAGITTPANFLHRTPEEFYRVTNVNVLGSIYFIQEFIKRHIDKPVENPSIVNIGSIYGVIGPDMRIYKDYNVATPEVYGMSKASLLQLTRYLASVYASSEIRVNAVSPGGIYNKKNPQGDAFVTDYSNRVPIGRMANVEEMVAAVVFLSGPGASYVTGQNLLIDGGLSCW